MKSRNTYYTTKEELKSFLNSEKIQNNSSLLIQVFSGISEKVFLSKLLSVLNQLLPDAVVIGSTTDGEIMDGKVSSNKVVLSFTLFEHTRLKVAAVEHKEDGYCSGQYLAKELMEEETKLLIAFADGLHTNGDNFLKGISSIKDDVIVAGGHAGDGSEFKKTMVFTKEHIFEKGAVGVSLNSKLLHVNTDYNFDWHPIGNELTVTRAEGNRIYSIDGKSAETIYAHYLGEEIAKGLPGIGIEFPLILNRNGFDIARSVMIKMDDGSLIVAGDILEGEKIRMGFGSRKEIINASYAIAKNISKKPSEVLFVYSCNARKHFMGSEIEAEILPLSTIAPISGFFTYGEFFTSNKSELLNQTMTLLSLSESSDVNEISFHNKSKQASVHNASLDALTHLINVSSQEVKKQTQVLRESYRLNKYLKERMEMALSGSKTSVLDWDFSDNSIYISPSWKQMLGYRDEELPNALSSWSNRVHRDDQKNILSLLREYQDNKQEYFESTHRLKHKDGHWVWVLGRAKIIYDEHGEKVRMVGTHTDITEEKELQLKYFYQSEMINQINDSITTTDLTGTIVSWNKGSEKTFGYTAEEVIGQSITMLYKEEDRESLKEYIPALMQKGVHNTDLELVTKSGELIPISFSLSILRDEFGKPIGIVGINKDNTRRKQAEDALLEQKEILHHQAHHDALTGLPNRTFFTKRLAKCIEKSKKEKIGFALFFIDLDKFKDINDSLGHEVGDRVLKLISKRLQTIIRKEDDTLARLSGDEFTIIMGNLKEGKYATMMAEKILSILEEPITIDDRILYVSGSIGITFYPEDASSAEYLLKYADTAMYNAKEDGRNTYKFYTSEMTEAALEHMSMKTALQQAISKKEFFIHYQPQIDTLTDTLVGLEALIRWDHPEKGLLSPSQFITLAEETGLIVEIDRWMMKTAMEQISSWYQEGLIPGVLGLNLSIKQLEGNSFVKELKENMETFDFHPEWLELEITEGQMMKKPEDATVKLKEINALGIGISIDDFGTGYSSLSLLKRLPINRLKIDRSFIFDILTDPDDMAIVQTIIVLAKSLKLNIIAEGVETVEQKDLLIAHGCSNMQGYYFSPPIPAEAFKKKFLL